MSEKLLIVFNPTSQSGRTEARLGEIEDACRSLGIAYDLMNTLPGALTSQMVCERVKGCQYPLVLGVGGDGTITDIIQGIMVARDQHQIPIEKLPRFSLLPLGTGNNIAKSLGIDLQQGIKEALRQISQGDDLLVDLGRVDGIYFANAFTIGVDTSILMQRNVDREKVSRIPLIKILLRDYFLYFISFMKKIFTYKAFEATITLDGRHFKFPELYNLVVNNAKVYAGVFDFSKKSSIEVLQDGVFDLVFFTGRNDYVSKLIMASRIHPINQEQFKVVKVEHSQDMQAKSIIIHLGRPISAQIDGEEYLTKERFELNVIPQALYFRVPKKK